MLDRRDVFLAALITIVTVAFPVLLPADAPPGWFLAGSKSSEYQVGIDPEMAYNGMPSAYLKGNSPESCLKTNDAGKQMTTCSGTLMQNFSAEQYLGKRVRFSAFVKTAGVKGWAGLWMNINRGHTNLAFDDTPHVKGDADWRQYEVVLDVPNEAISVIFGVMLSGPGTVWLSGVEFDVVGPEVPVTHNAKKGPNLRRGPSNLFFEEKALFSSAAGGLEEPSNWFLTGNKPDAYEAGIDAYEVYKSHPSAYLKGKTPKVCVDNDTASLGGAGKCFGTLMQTFSAEQFAGKRVRFSAFSKAIDVTNHARLWMRVDKGDTMLAFGDMRPRIIKGQHTWEKFDIVLDVPKAATAISIGILLSGPGTVWINGAEFEAVGKDVPVSSEGSDISKAQSEPTNLGFGR